MQCTPRANVHLVSLKGFEAFQDVLSRGKRFTSQGITGFVLFKPATEAGSDLASNTIYFGVTAKKRTRPAVMRNRIKRLLRESLRLSIKKNLPRKPTQKIQVPVQEMVEAIVLIGMYIPEKPQMLHLQDVLPGVQTILKRAKEYYHKQYTPAHETIPDTPT